MPDLPDPQPWWDHTPPRRAGLLPLALAALALALLARARR
jgi:hypothetical protein